MDRRRFLTLTGLAAGSVASLPAVLRAFAAAPGIHPHAPDLHSEQLLATAAGKPLLILVSPVRRGVQNQDWGDTGKRQQAFGAWLAHGDTQSLSRAALCHVTCAPIEDVRAAVPGLPHTTDVPWMVLVETGTSAGGVRVSGVLDVPDRPSFWKAQRDAAENDDEDWETSFDEEHAEAVLGAVEQVDEALAGLLASQTLALRASQSASVLSPEELATLEQEGPRPDRLDPDLAWRAAALMAWQVEDALPEAQELVAEGLASLASARYLDDAPRGSHWARSTGCATDITCDLPDPDAPRYTIGCGMGRVPKLGRRFLMLLTEH
jgi:hypothetical protein